jgi:hypothetical protein
MRECHHTKTLWLLLIDWLNSLNMTTPQFTFRQAILGDRNQLKQIEHIKLITKYYIYLSRLDETKPNFRNLLLAIKHKIKIEKYSTNNTDFWQSEERKSWL